MIIRTVAQPETQLGNEISELLAADVVYSRIVFVSAFVALRTILRLRDPLLARVERGTSLRFIVGIDVGGTSRDVLEELLRWDCETFVFHNPIVRATFHPKFYLFESQIMATLFVGSNNLTDGGFYTNYEASTRYNFTLPSDAKEYEDILRPLAQFIDPQGVTVQRLDAQLIQTLVDRGELLSEAEARQQQRHKTRDRSTETETLPDNPFTPVATPLPPLLPGKLRASDVVIAQPQPLPPITPITPNPRRVLIWRKNLPKSDALQVNLGTHHVGGVRLTQARFENPPGHRIDQTTYFRQLFADYPWENETERNIDQEHTFAPMRIFIRGRDYGIRNFEISHKPSGEAGQDNYTTILRWGRDFNPVISQEHLTGTIFSLYETDDETAPFLIDITD